MLFTPITVLALLSLSRSARANPEPRPPGPPPVLDLNQLATLNLTPQQALDAEARANNDVVSNMLGPHPIYARPDPALSQLGNILIASSDMPPPQFLGDGSLDGSGVWANTSDIAATMIFPATTCSTLPPLFSIYGILREYAPLPYVGLATFTGLPDAASSLGPGKGGYAFIAPVNQTNTKSFAQSDTSLGSPYRGESAVWSLNCITRELTASWTMADGTQLPIAFTSYSKDGLVGTGDFNAFKAAFPTAEAPIKFTFNPTGPTAATFWSAQAQPQALPVPPVAPFVQSPAPPVVNSAAIPTQVSTRAARTTRPPKTTRPPRTRASAAPTASFLGVVNPNGVLATLGQNVQANVQSLGMAQASAVAAKHRHRH